MSKFTEPDHEKDKKKNQIIKIIIFILLNLNY